MSDKTKSKPAPSAPLSTGDLPIQSPKKIQIRYRPSPSPRPPDKKIHPRQKIPPVPEGEEVPDENPSPPVELD
jgi:hypothetical protein